MVAENPGGPLAGVTVLDLTRVWHRFCGVAGLPALAADERFATSAGRVLYYDALAPPLVEAMARRTRADWTACLSAAGVPSGPVRTVDEALADTQLAARGMIERLLRATAGPITVPACP